MKGIEYYSTLINGLIEKGIEPLVTIFHWDLPQYIQDMGGWTNPMVVDYYREYVDALFLHFGTRVKRWITFNEPSVFCNHGWEYQPQWHSALLLSFLFSYGLGTKAPAIEQSGIADYLCTHNVLLSNAAAYHLYKEKYFEEQQGEVGICLTTRFSYPFNDTVDQSVAEKSIQFDLGIYSHSIFSEEGEDLE